jgi:hypothetical protein
VGVVTATTGYVNGQPVHTPMAEGEILNGVALSASIQLHFDRFLLPHKVTRQSICLRADTTEVADINECGEPGQEFTEPSYDPVSRQVTYRLPPGQRLSPDTVYRLTVFRQADVRQAGMFAFDEAPLARSYTFSFRTQATGGAEQDELLPSPEAYCASVNCFDACKAEEATCKEPCLVAFTVCEDACADDEMCIETCTTERNLCSAPCIAPLAACDAVCEPLCIEPRCEKRGRLHENPEAFLFFGCGFANCHAPATPGSTAGTAAGLNLKTLEGVRATAIGQIAHQTQQGQQSVTGDQSPLRFGRAMPNIDPGNPGNSYALYKVIIHPLNHYKADEQTLEPQLAASIQRLRETVVVGVPMPAENGLWQPYLPLQDDSDPRTVSLAAQQHMQMLSSWIAYGAVTECP